MQRKDTTTLSLERREGLGVGGLGVGGWGWGVGVWRLAFGGAPVIVLEDARDDDGDGDLKVPVNEQSKTTRNRC